MKTYFDEDIFFVKHLSRSLTMLMMYYVLLKHPFSCFYNLNLIPQENIRELILIIVGLPDIFISVGAAIAIAILSIIENCVHLSSFYGKLSVDKLLFECDSINNYKGLFRLDMSNSFLYSDKTHSLLE